MNVNENKKELKILMCLLLIGVSTVTIRNDFLPVISAMVWCIALFYCLLTLLK